MLCRRCILNNQTELIYFLSFYIKRTTAFIPINIQEQLNAQQ